MDPCRPSKILIKWEMIRILSVAYKISHGSANYLVTFYDRLILYSRVSAAMKQVSRGQYFHLY